MKISSFNKGFSLVEIIVVLAIIGIIATIAMYSYSTARSKKQVEVTIDAIHFKLEEAKSNALAGKDGNSFGLYFSTTSYTYFPGTSYIPNSPTNSSTTIATTLQIIKNLSGNSSTIIFSRLTGLPSATGTITVRQITNASNTASVTVGTSGYINVVK